MIAAIVRNPRKNLTWFSTLIANEKFDWDIPTGTDIVCFSYIYRLMCQFVCGLQNYVRLHRDLFIFFTVIKTFPRISPQSVVNLFLCVYKSSNMIQLTIVFSRIWEYSALVYLFHLLFYHYLTFSIYLYSRICVFILQSRKCENPL